jgi:ribonuclease HI
LSDAVDVAVGFDFETVPTEESNVNVKSNTNRVGQECPTHTGRQTMTTANTRPAYTAHIDGGARGNPGPAGYGVVVHDASGRKVAELSEYLGHQTNNYAEYQGLLGVLRYALANGVKALKVVSDSELMVRQMKGIYKVKHPELRKLYEEAQQMVRKLEHFEIRHAMREHNVDADRLANEAMDRGRSR